jgi:GAF domain-containing protein
MADREPGERDPNDADALRRAALRAIAARLEAVSRLEPGAGEAVLRSIVEATVALFDAEAASLALHDPATDRLVFRVAAGPRGAPVVGLSIPASEGVAGYVFSTGEPLAIGDTSTDPRFSDRAAARTAYTPRSLVAVPLVDDDGAIGVLEVLDRRGGGSFTLRDIELAGVFARQATVAIRAVRLDRDATALLRSVLSAAAGDAVDAGQVDALVSDAVAELEADGAVAAWRLADRIALLRAADPAELEVAAAFVDVLLDRSARVRASRNRTARRPTRGT